MSGPLESTQVLDLTDEIGFLCGKILGDLGAEVIKVEPPGGAPSRQIGPYVDNEPGSERSLYWEAYNNNKKGITLDVTTNEGRELFEELVKTADFLVESFEPGFMDNLGLGYEALADITPELVYVSITPWGQEGPYSDFRASDLEMMAASGCMSVTGEADREPLRVSVPQSYMWAGMAGAMGALTAHYPRLISGRGQHVDTSGQAASIMALIHAPMFPPFTGENPRREGPFISGRSTNRAKFRAIWPCKDGYLNFIVYGGKAGQHTNKQLVKWMDERDMAPDHLLEKDWSDFDVSILTQEELDRIEEPIGEFFETVTKEEFFRNVIERRILGYPVANAADIHADNQLRARDFWTTIEHPEHGEIEYPGGFAKFSKDSCEVRQPAPLVGEHNTEVLGDKLGLDGETIEQLSDREVV
jgi:crotonobetainyl-CoA:carnitine CoA-transferase CaiB-like acyl-CoA transferase